MRIVRRGPPGGLWREREGIFLEPRQHLLLDAGDLLAQRFDLGRGPAAGARALEDGVDLAEDVTELGMRLDGGAGAELRAVPFPQRVLTQLTRLVEEHARLVLVAAQELADRLAHLRALRRIAPEHVLEEGHVLVLHRRASVEV